MLKTFNRNSFKYFFNKQSLRCFSNKQSSIILGIETSCDDTGCAIVDNQGNILGEALNSQHLIHLR